MEHEKITEYINQLYDKKSHLKQKEYTAYMQLRDYIPTVDDEAARFLRLIIKLTRPKNILEIGTSVGFSTTSMALASKEYGGHITTIEFDEKSADQAEKNFKKAGVYDCITIIRGDAVEILHGLTDTYDLIFQDADKKLYSAMFDDCIRVLSSNGVLLSDDALFPVMELDSKWNDLIEPIKAYNEKVINCPILESVLLPIGDGMMMSVRRQRIF